MTRRNLPVETGGPERQPSTGKKEEVGRPGGWIKLEYLKNNPSQRQGADEVREERERELVPESPGATGRISGFHTEHNGKLLDSTDTQ